MSAWAIFFALWAVAFCSLLVFFGKMLWDNWRVGREIDEEDRE